jgi:4-hydroxy-3-polyprenylbenzoate decarboxylase
MGPVTRIFLGITGASGAPYAARALEALTGAGCEVGLCVSRAGAHVLSHELLDRGPGPPADPGAVVEEVVAAHALAPGRVEVLGLQEMTSRFASGSARSGGALIAPCSGSTLGAIASGVGANLVHRCADVMLKERRPLVLVPRETPVSAIHLENMLTLTRAGAVVMPAAPGFYNRPARIEDLVDFVVGKALDHLGVEHDLLKRWGEAAPAGEAYR